MCAPTSSPRSCRTAAFAPSTRASPCTSATKAPDGSFRDIFVNDDRNPNESLQYSAAHGLLLERGGGSFLVLQNGDLIRQDRVSATTNVVDFETYALDLSQLGSPDTTAIYKARERSTLYLLDPDPGDSTIAPGASRVIFELHNRITSPLYTLAFALVALAFLGRPRTNRQDRSFAIAAACSFCIALRTAGFAAAALSNNSLAARSPSSTSSRSLGSPSALRADDPRRAPGDPALRRGGLGRRERGDPPPRFAPMLGRPAPALPGDG